MSEPRERFRFGDFELDVAAYDLRRNGRAVRLERQPMDLLIMLVERRGALVSRSEIIGRLWGQDVFVDVETGVHTAIRKVRQALRDSADRPTFVETIPGRGYRFVAPVEVVTATADSVESPPAGLKVEPEAVRSIPNLPNVEADGQEPRASNGVTADSASPPEVRVGSRHIPWLAVLVAATILASLAVWLPHGRGTSEPAKPIRLAVLPFENLTTDPDREYLADGLTEDTIATVGRLDPERLGVIGRTSTMAYKRTTKSLAAIGRELGVDYLVESSLRAEGSRLLVTSKLIRAPDQVQVWSASYSRHSAAMLDVQQELSAAIAEQVRLRLSVGPTRVPERRQTRNAAAYDEYLRGRYFENQRNPRTITRAIDHYKQAIAIDPGYALAWSELAFTYGGGALNSDTNPQEVIPRIREAVANAVREQPNLSEAQFIVGYLNWLFEWDWQAAEAGFRKAAELDPANAAAHRTLGHALSQLGRHREAGPEMRRAREIDPFDPINDSLSSQVAFQSRDFAAAVEHARQAIRVDSAFWIAHMNLGQAYEQLGQTELALEALAEAARLSDGNSKPVALRGYILAKSGRASQAREVLRHLDARSRERYVPPYASALVYAGLGERAAVFDWLNKAYAARDVHLIFLPVDPKWDPYRNDPRFREILSRCGFDRAVVAGRVTTDDHVRASDVAPVH
ncbi:MAG TPA: winged helix-turn-helix domain-containing protein [Vicinamibacterales bacterium]|nr:winged helix-turn-helix domain-containing protein [Vicinamibacterales bacterium]